MPSTRLHEEGCHSLWTLFESLESEHALLELLQLLLTPEEYTSLIDRCLIIKKLMSKQPQRQISEELGVSISKITRGSNELKRISPRLKQYLEKILAC